MTESNKDNSTLNEIYMQISVESTFDNFDNREVNDLLEKVIADNFKKELILIDSAELQKDVVKLNESFVLLVNHCKKDIDFKIHIGYLFIFYVDYFSLDFTQTYAKLHNKIQRIVEFYFKSKIGNDHYNRLKKRYSSDDTEIKSLFDL